MPYGMIELWMESLWFFLPAVIANQCPGFAAKLNLPGNVPVDEEWLGKNKTWAAYYVCPLGATVTIYLQGTMSSLNNVYALIPYEESRLWLLGLLFGLGTAIGDHLKSFIKRRLGKKPGAMWWPFDQVDYVFGCIFTVGPLVEDLTASHWAAILITVLLLQPIVNGLGYWLGLRQKWM